MNKSILGLVIFGLALAVLHIPNVVLMVGLILGLVTVTIKLFWKVIQTFSHSASSSRASART